MNSYTFVFAQAFCNDTNEVLKTLAIRQSSILDRMVYEIQLVICTCDAFILERKLFYLCSFQHGDNRIRTHGTVVCNIVV